MGLPVLLLSVFLCILSGHGHQDIYVRDNVLSLAQCFRMIDQTNPEKNMQMLDKDGKVSKDLFPLVKNSLELYMEHAQFPLYPDISSDTGYMYYRFCSEIF